MTLPSICQAISLVPKGKGSATPMSYYEFAFEGPVERLGIGKTKILYYCVIMLPDEVIETLPFDRFPRLRVIGEVAECPVRGAWQPVGDGRKYFILSAKFLKDAGLSVGSWTEMRFNIDDQDHVDVPNELERIIETREDIKQIWDTLSPGKKRFHCHAIDSGKTEKTRTKRVASVIQQLEEIGTS